MGTIWTYRITKYPTSGDFVIDLYKRGSLVHRFSAPQVLDRRFRDWAAGVRYDEPQFRLVLNVACDDLQENYGLAAY